MTGIVYLAVLFLAFVNGANDNTKGVATLVGSGTLPYPRALTLATISTALGSVMSVFLAGTLIRAFSGKGLVPAEALTPPFLAAVALGAALTVLLATRLGLPISTTHAIVGALAGAGWMAAGSALNLGALGATFALPLIVGPVLAIGLAYLGLSMGRRMKHRLGITNTSCVCVGETWIPVGEAALESHTAGQSARAAVAAPALSLTIDDTTECRQRYRGRVIGIDAHTAVDSMHTLSGTLVSFARGLNDTPKIVGLAVAASTIPLTSVAVGVGLAMAIGGILQARRVTETLARKITPMTPGQGLSANLATSLLVIGASRFGLPVSTTHVSTGSIFGIGGANGTMRWTMANEVMAAWVTTLPLAALIAASLMSVLA